MSDMEAFSIAGSAFSIFLAGFAVWFAFVQRRESQDNYANTKDVLGEITRVSEKTEMLVSENFQRLLGSIVDQQAQMLDSLKPRPTAQDKYADFIMKLAAEDPEKL